MKVKLVGMGPGAANAPTSAVLCALQQADAILGAQRLLDALPQSMTQNRIAATDPAEILRLLCGGSARQPCVVYSGDTGFYSGARGLAALLREQGIEAEVLAGVSSVQYFAARLGRSWQDWRLVSAHGTACDAAAQMCAGTPVFFLTGGALGPNHLCAQLAEAGLPGLRVTVGENLSYDTETIESGTAAAFSVRRFAPLSVLLAEAVARPLAPRTPGFADEAFIRGTTPMTKQEVRVAALAKLGVRPSDVCWDIGAGTGSVSVELALQTKAVYAVERSAEACALILQNKARFGAWNLHLCKGTAPDALQQLPAPDAVFVGGSGGALPEILRCVRAANPKARVCVAAIALETLHAALAAMTKGGYETEVVQMSVSRAKKAGELHLLLAQNPVFLLTGALV